MKPRLCVGCRVVTDAPIVAEDNVTAWQSSPSSEWESFECERCGTVDIRFIVPPIGSSGAE